ncbi:MAG: hypothetical protein LBU95_06195 [Rikenellaceae bacterium]|jgi:beta-galactosidase|nr:hypothetical protein [Rikenellaceae bacterium]
MNIRKISLLLPCVLLSLYAVAQTFTPASTSVGRAPARAEFMSYDVRDAAEARVPEKAGFAIFLTGKFTKSPKGYQALADIPWQWLDREFFLHVQGVWSAFRLYINDVQVGYAEDSKTPADFNLTAYLVEGPNKILIEPETRSGGAFLESGHTPAEAPASLGEVYLWSQPRTRIEDFSIVCASAWIDLKIVMANGYNYDETVQVGYDMYDPTGKMVFYNRREVKLDGGEHDTVRFNEYIPNTGKYLWTPVKPELFRVMLTVWKGGRVIEYIPLKVGFTAKEPYQANLTAVKAAASAGKIALYNAPVDAVKAKTELTALKKQGTTMVRVSYPQSVFFYDLCDQIGMQVIDQANISCPSGRLDRAEGGTPSNDPRQLAAYLERQRYMQARTRNRTCVVAWSPGAMSGNGYNMYRSYQLLRETDPSRPVYYDDAGGEWNRDL